MNTQTISPKFQALYNDLFLGFVSGSLESLLTNLENITNPYLKKPSKTHEIKYFNFSDTINGFSNLKPNWDSYNADKISRYSIEIALKVLNYLLNSGLLSTEISINVFPMRDGGIQFEFDGDNICIELEINPKGELIFIEYDEEADIVKKEQLFELTEISSLLEEAQNA